MVGSVESLLYPRYSACNTDTVPYLHSAAIRMDSRKNGKFEILFDEEI